MAVKVGDGGDGGDDGDGNKKGQDLYCITCHHH